MGETFTPQDHLALCQASIAGAEDARGTARDTAGNPLAAAILDVWETARYGLDDVQDSDQPPMNLRGVVTIGDDGACSFATVRPSA